MDSSEEISDNILEYLLDNGRECDSSFLTEGENVSTATDNELIYGSELDCSLNPISLQSAKKLEWDSSADVGSLPQRTTQVNPKLSTLERMALSNSASKLCTDEDDRLLAKIDRVLARSRQPSKTFDSLTKRPPKLPTWTTVDSGSNVSLDTVIPNLHEKDATTKRQPGSSKLVKAYSHDQFQICNSYEDDLKYQSHNNREDLNFVSHTHAKYHKRISPDSEKLFSGTSKAPYHEDSCEMFVTRSVASEDGDPKAGNSQRSVSITPSNVGEQEIPQSECRCMSGDISERTCPTHTTLSTEHTRRLHREAVGELHMYRGLKEHLRSLRDYVAQLEQTWKFLDQTKSGARSLRQESGSSRRSRRRMERVPSVMEESSASSIRTRTSEILSSPAPSPISMKSDRSFELERLNLHDTDSSETPTTQPTKPVRPPKSKCCTHCSLNKPKPVKPTPSRKPSKGDIGVQTSDRCQKPEKPSENRFPAQREPIAFDISVNGKHRSKDTDRPSSKTSLQEALKEKRPDFCQESARRQQALQEIAQLRRTGAIDCNAIPRLFSYHELRKQTEQIYRQLPEVRFKNRDQKRKENVTSNRIKASVYQKKLQSRVLQGQLNLPHSTCL